MLACLHKKDQVLAKRKMIVNLHGVGYPDRALESGEGDSIIDVSILEHVLDRVAEKSAMITVDDGNISDVEIILPNLKKRDLTAMFFIPAGKVGQQGYLTRDDVVTLQQEGMTIGSHGMNHVNWRELDDRELERELVESKRFLENLTGSPVISVACPFGAYDRRVLRFIRKAGYEKIYTSDMGWANSDDWLIGRNSIRSSDSVQSTDRLLGTGFSCVEQAVINLKKTLKRWR